jgi:hypothetical protein
VEKLFVMVWAKSGIILPTCWRNKYAKTIEQRKTASRRNPKV